MEENFKARINNKWTIPRFPPISSRLVWWYISFLKTSNSPFIIMFINDMGGFFFEITETLEITSSIV
jgi:hypothetical protein